MTAKYTNGANIEVSAAFKTSNTITPANFTIENRTGSLLPSTGGIGITIFYIASIILVIGAATLLITKKKRNA